MTTAETFYVAETDTLPYAQSTLRDGGGNPIPLSAGDAAIFKMRRYETDGPIIGGAAIIVAPGVTVDDPRCGQVQFQWPDGAPLAGIYECQWKVTFEDGKQTHFPNRGFDVLEISPIIPDPA